ncbi:SH3 domain-binding glutamic acid-rich-like protein 3 [Littorina saxatilis]|uniref:SH3 domain-binding glutamic acid-rich-like protein 3 n=1 Tax=Littorina saxatilis TaxID=31220 RepID=A0AAN9AVX6_9CAEN
MGDSANIQLYVTSVSSSTEVKGQQQKIRMILEGKKIDFEEVDIASDTSLLIKMREIANDPKCLPPQLARGSDYLGDYEKFNNAVEDEALKEFLKL